MIMNYLLEIAKILNDLRKDALRKCRKFLATLCCIKQR